jgi:hypothetical protein
MTNIEDPVPRDHQTPGGAVGKVSAENLQRLPAIGRFPDLGHEVIVGSADVQCARVVGIDCARGNTEIGRDCAAAGPRLPEVLAGEQAIKRYEERNLAGQRVDDARV